MNKKLLVLVALIMIPLVSCGDESSSLSNSSSDSTITSQHPQISQSGQSSSSEVIVPPLPGEPSSTYAGTYYNDISDFKRDEELKRDLSTLTSKNFTNHSYADLKNLYHLTDVVDGKMVLYYTGSRVSYSKGSVPGNKEHVWPQSWYGAGSSHHSDGSPGADAHNIFPCDTGVNSTRSHYSFDVMEQNSSDRVTEKGNYNYAVPASDPDSYIYKQKHTVDVGGVSDGIFYPKKGYRGIVARTLMYVATRYFNDKRYPVELVDVAVTSAKTGEYGRIGKLSTLLQWNLDEPVSAYEIQRNEAVYKNWHNNRNPFVDHPKYACRIFGNTTENTKAVCGLK